MTFMVPMIAGLGAIANSLGDAVIEGLSTCKFQRRMESRGGGARFGISGLRDRARVMEYKKRGEISEESEPSIPPGYRMLLRGRRFRTATLLGRLGTRKREVYKTALGMTISRSDRTVQPYGHNPSGFSAFLLLHTQGASHS